MVTELIEKTFIAVKHDGVQRGLVGNIIKRFEQRGLKLVGMKMVLPTEEMAGKHYVLTPAFIEKLGNNTRKAAASKGIEISSVVFPEISAKTVLLLAPPDTTLE